MERMLFWGVGLFILVFLAFIPLTFQIQFRLAESLTLNLSGTSGATCYVGLSIGWGRAPGPVSQLRGL